MRRELQDAYTNGKHRPASTRVEGEEGEQRDPKGGVGGVGGESGDKAQPPPFSYVNFSVSDKYSLLKICTLYVVFHIDDILLI